MEKDKSIHYNEEAEKHAKSGKVNEAAKKAKDALNDEREGQALREAEQKGKSRSQ
jgi:hypothetical protein